MQPTKSDWHHLDTYLKVFSQISQNFLADLDERNVAYLGEPLENKPLSSSGEGFEKALETLCDKVIPNLSASRGSRYWGFVTGGATPVATFADWLVATFDQNLSKGGDSIATDVERQTLRWLCELFDLPECFQGIITTGATSANFLGVLCARQYLGKQQNIDVAENGINGLDIEVFVATPHASMLKSLAMAGLGRRNLTQVNCEPDSEAMSVCDLELKLNQSVAKGKLVIASAATVTTTDFDDLKAIALLTKKHRAWLHVDAAFGLFERLLNKEEYLTDGVELVDSITVDNHKWLNVPYESGVFLTRHLDMLYESCDVPAPYLISNPETPDFMSLGVENSRRFRALPVWMTLLAYGKAGVAGWVDKNIKLARLFAKKIESSEDYELMLPCQLNVVLFRPDCHGLTENKAREKTQYFLQKINQSGRVFLSPGEWRGQSVIRAALSSWETQAIDIDIVFDVLLSVAKVDKMNCSWLGN